MDFGGDHWKMKPAANANSGFRGPRRGTGRWEPQGNNYFFFTIACSLSLCLKFVILKVVDSTVCEMKLIRLLDY